MWYNIDALLVHRIGQRWRATRAVYQVCGEDEAFASSFSLPLFSSSLETKAVNSGGAGAEPPISSIFKGYLPVVTN